MEIGDAQWNRTWVFSPRCFSEILDSARLPNKKNTDLFNKLEIRRQRENRHPDVEPNHCCFITVTHSQKRGGWKWGGQIGVTGEKGDRNEIAGLAAG